MKLRALSLAGLLVALIANAGPVSAAEPAKQVALAHRYILAAHMSDAMQSTLKSITPMILSRAGSLSANDKKVLTDSIDEASRDFFQRYVERIEPVIADLYSEQELTDLIAFYESSTGQAVLARTPMLQEKLKPIMQALLPDYEAGLMEQVCARVDCSSAEPTPAAAKHSALISPGPG